MNAQNMTRFRFEIGARKLVEHSARLRANEGATAEDLKHELVRIVGTLKEGERLEMWEVEGD